VGVLTSSAVLIVSFVMGIGWPEAVPEAPRILLLAADAIAIVVLATPEGRLGGLWST
jgi:hypothetical protein